MSGRGFPNLTKDPFSQRHPQAWVKQNGMADQSELTARRAATLDATNGTKIMFSMQGLPGDLQEQNILNPEWVPCFVMKRSWNTHGSNMNRTMLTQETAIPALTQLNGIEGGREEIREKIEPLGVIEMGNADNGSTRFNILSGGGFSLMFNGPNGCRLNALIELDVPTLEEAKHMKSHLPAYAMGLQGITPLITREWNPHTADYLSNQSMAYYLSKECRELKEEQPIQTRALVQLVKALWCVSKNIDSDKVDDDDVDFVTYIDALAAHYDGVASSGKSTMQTRNFNRAVQALGAIRLDREKWVKFQAEQVGLNGQWTAVHAINYCA